MGQMKDAKHRKRGDGRCPPPQGLDVLLDLASNKAPEEQLTTCSNTRCKNTCMTAVGFGNTAFIICASSLTVARISLNNAVRPGSEVGGGVSGSPIIRHLSSALAAESNSHLSFGLSNVLQ